MSLLRMNNECYVQERYYYQSREVVEWIMKYHP